MKPQFEAINAQEELPPLAGPGSSYYQLDTSERVHIIGETFGGYQTKTCGVYDYKRTKWLTSAGVKTVFYWLKEI